MSLIDSRMECSAYIDQATESLSGLQEYGPNSGSRLRTESHDGIQCLDVWLALEYRGVCWAKPG